MAALILTSVFAFILGVLVGHTLTDCGCPCRDGLPR